MDFTMSQPAENFLNEANAGEELCKVHAVTLSGLGQLASVTAGIYNSDDFHEKKPDRYFADGSLDEESNPACFLHLLKPEGQKSARAYWKHRRALLRDGKIKKGDYIRYHHRYGIAYNDRTDAPELAYDTKYRGSYPTTVGITITAHFGYLRQREEVRAGEIVANGVQLG